MMMCWRTHLCLLVAFVQIFSIAASTDANDFVALKSLKGTWNNEPPNWANNDPCASDWDGIKCSNDRVVSITLASISLSGRLSSNITKLSELQILDLSSNKRLIGPLPESIGDLKNLSSLNLAGCGFSGQLPHSIGSLQKLVYLFLNSNNFYGKIPPSIGNLSNLYLLDLSDNKLSGSIPVSKGSTPGLDMLVNTWHFHLGKNQLSGEIPYQLFSSNMKLIHLLLENNQLTGSIPSSIGLVQTLEIIRLDRNFLSEPLPENLNNLTQVQDLYLANNKLTGPLPNLNGMNWLQNVDFSNNSFDATDIRQWFSSLPNLTSLIMENTGIQGQLPVSLFSLSALQTILMKKNRINGTLNISSSNSNQLKLIDLQDNLIEDLTPRAGYSFQIILVGNPICDGEIKANYCAIPQQSNLSYSMPEENCTFLSCSAFKVLSPTCRCAYPYSGNLYFRAPSIFSLGNESLFKSLERTLMDSFTSHSQPVDSVHVSDPTQNIDGYLVLNLQIFPSGKDYFNRKEISGIGFMLSNQTFEPPKGFGPFSFKANEYLPFVESTAESHKSSRTTMIIGEAVGGSVLVLLLLITGLCAFHQNKRAETPSRRMDPFGLISCFCLICYLWPKLKRKESREAPQNLLLLDLNSNRPMYEKRISVGNSHGEEINNHYELPIFSFSSIVASTNNFSITNKLGQGGYGPVYKGELLNKQLIAVKRLSRRSGQGPEEFKNEIELTAKLQHRNLVGIFGCCIENDEKILVYEYMPNKSLDLYLFDPAKRELLDWKKRLHIIDGIARGLLYLHHDSRLRVVHRDLKASNILLDANMNAKISDFGLARIFGGNDSEASTKRIVGTYGYMSPEYAMQGLFSLKSDVFAFGVLTLEIISGKKNTGFYGSEYLSLLGYAWNLWENERVLELIDPVLEIPASSSSMALRCIQIGLLCVQENPAIRPLMFDVVTMLNNKEPEMASPQHPAFTTGQTWAEASPTQREVEICSPNGLTDSILEAR